MKISWSNIVEEAIGGILVLAIWGLLSYLFNLIIKNNNAQIIIWLIPLVIILISVRILGWPTIRKWIAVLGRSILNNLWLVIGLSLLVGVVLGVFWLTNSYWFILLTGVFAIALISMEFWFYRILSRQSSDRKAIFRPIYIQPGVGNTYFGDRYLDLFSGNKITEDMGYHLKSDALIIDTSETLRQAQPITARNEKYVKLTLPKPVNHVKSVRFLINSGNSKKVYLGERIGKIELLFRDGPPQSVDLILGKNIREWCPGNAPNELIIQTTDPNNRVLWRGASKEGKYAVIDQLEIPVFEIYREKELEGIIFTHYHLESEDDRLGVQYSVYALALEVEV